MPHLRAVLLATIITMGMVPAAHSATDQQTLAGLLREAAPRFGTVFSAQAVAQALQKSKTVCICFDREQNASRAGFIVYVGPQASGEGFTALCLTPVFTSDGAVTGGTGACADFTPIPGSNAP
jgi:LDH2 family malate/lactate/ureidoglycolate dehydrogenase